VSTLPHELQRPAPEMLRQLTDRRVFEQLLAAGSLTRAEIASRTGISKPTISESVRRLLDARLVLEGGLQSGGRGRAGTYCRLRTDTTSALAVSMGPDGIVVDTYDLLDGPLAHLEQPVPAPVTGAVLGPLLQAAVRSVLSQTPGAVRSCVVSVAAPVDRRTGRVVPLRYSPFLVGAFDVRQSLAAVAPHVEVDNDVNWAALAEHDHGSATDLDDFALCYLGAGIGSALVVGGTVVGGSRGMAGELARAWTTGPGGRSLRLYQCFGALGLLRAGSDAIDVPLVRAVLQSSTTADRRCRDRVLDAVAGALNSLVALLDPRGLLVGGPWGHTPGLLDLLTERLDEVADQPLLLRPAALLETPDRDGIRLRSVAAARQAVADRL
jgi:predicted NBD/HSP70 family sugar kinase